MRQIYHCNPRFSAELKAELPDAHELAPGLFASAASSLPAFAEDIWFDAEQVSFQSISEASKILRVAGKYWHHHPVSHIRRATLIQENLRKTPKLDFTFPPTAFPEIGCFSLLDPHTLLYASRRWKRAPMGQYPFIEDKVNPPNRAYLKLWEALSLLEEYPKPGQTTMDLGASPGGWSYVLQSFGAQVIAVDKAPLAANIAKKPLIQSLQQSAFALNPNDFKRIDLLVCDIACYPERLYELVQQWLKAGNVQQMICTIKLQGETNFTEIQKFQAIPSALVLHLSCNKNELTFFHPAPKGLSKP